MSINSPITCTVLSLTLVACAALPRVTPGPLRIDNVQPANYVQQIKSMLQNSLYDPESMKSFKVIRPVYKATCLLHGSKTPVEYWTAVVSYNSKNQYGGYTGAKSYRYLFKNGVLTPNSQYSWAGILYDDMTDPTYCADNIK
jgi:hypothetical protein